MRYTLMCTLILIFGCSSFAAVQLDLISLSTVFRMAAFLLPIFICKKKKQLAILSTFAFSVCVLLNHAIICILASKTNGELVGITDYIARAQCGVIDLGISFVFFIGTVALTLKQQKDKCEHAVTLEEIHMREKWNVDNYVYVLFISTLAFTISACWDYGFLSYIKTFLITISADIFFYVYYKLSIKNYYLTAYTRIVNKVNLEKTQGDENED